MTDKTPDEQNGASAEQTKEKQLSEEQVSDVTKVSADQNDDSDSADNSAPATEKNGEQSSPEPAEPTLQKPVQDEIPKATKKQSGGWIKFIVAILIFVILVAGMLGAGWYWVNDKVGKVEAQIQQESQNYALSSALVEVADSLGSEFEPLREKNAELEQQIEYLQQKVQSQNLRILSMSTTSREDWLLAEAEYLLKLANQRILVERNADTAIGLLEEADAIMRDFSDPDLFPLRKALKEDLVALKLAKKIDVEGIYLELSALSENVTTLPLVPDSYTNNARESEQVVDDVEGSKPSLIQRFFGAFTDYVRVIQHDEKPEAILPPEDTKYLHLNLQFMFERAQIALLREQQDIYAENLLRANNWIKRYFPRSEIAEQFLSQTDALLEKNIVVTLPDISGSLSLLHDYINAMHAIGDDATGDVKTNTTDQDVTEDVTPATRDEDTGEAL